METVVIIVLLIILLGIWVVSVRRKLTVMDEHICNAMGQIGIQQSSRFDALMALLNLTRNYAPEESGSLIEKMKFKRNVITGRSTPEQVQEQENLIDDSLACVVVMAEHCPELEADKNYTKYLNAMDCYEKMLQTGRLIYNDSVDKFNREVRRLPCVLIAGMLGFKEKSNLQTERTE